jgi:hypothetical protein
MLLASGVYSVLSFSRHKSAQQTGKKALPKHSGSAESCSAPKLSQIGLALGRIKQKETYLGELLGELWGAATLWLNQNVLGELFSRSTAQSVHKVNLDLRRRGRISPSS